MSSMKGRKVAASLKKKGFREMPGRNKHTFFHFYYREKEYPIRTKMSKGGHGEEIPEHIIRAMADQLYLSRQEFQGLVDCPLTEEMYIDLMKQRGKLI